MYIKETGVLTPTGWTTLSSINKDTPIAIVDSKSNTFSFAKPPRFVKVDEPVECMHLSHGLGEAYVCLDHFLPDGNQVRRYVDSLAQIKLPTKALYVSSSSTGSYEQGFLDALLFERGSWGKGQASIKVYGKKADKIERLLTSLHLKPRKVLGFGMAMFYFDYPPIANAMTRDLFTNIEQYSNSYLQGLYEGLELVTPRVFRTEKQARQVEMLLHMMGKNVYIQDDRLKKRGDKEKTTFTFKQREIKVLASGFVGLGLPDGSFLLTRSNNNLLVI